MLKRDITYEDFDGEKVTETFYFNLTRAEIVEMEVSYPEGLQEALKRIVKANDTQNLVHEFKKLILLSYGVKSEDGKRFMKNAEIRESFSQTAAYDALFMELATSDDAAATFIKGIVPKEFSQEMEKTPIVPALPLTKE